MSIEDPQTVITGPCADVFSNAASNPMPDTNPVTPVKPTREQIQLAELFTALAKQGVDISLKTKKQP